MDSGCTYFKNGILTISKTELPSFSMYLFSNLFQPTPNKKVRGASSGSDDEGSVGRPARGRGRGRARGRPIGM